MSQNRRFWISPVLFILVALTLALIFSCSEQPTATNPDPEAGGSAVIDPGAGGRFLLSTVADTSFGSGTIEIWAMNVAFDDTAGMVTFDVQIVNHTQGGLGLPIDFVIKSINPNDIAVVDFDGTTWSGFPYYTFSQRLGGGDLLASGEMTEPVTMKFHTVTARSFAIGFYLVAGPCSGNIAGVVFVDADGDGERDRECRCEPGIPGITVTLELPLSNGSMMRRVTETDAYGEYRFVCMGEGVYNVHIDVPWEGWRVTSANPLLVTLVKPAGSKPQDFLGANFGLYPIYPKESLFGPITIGPLSPYGTELDSTFVNPPSLLPVVFHYYLDIAVPFRFAPSEGVIDSAAAWIDGEVVFECTEPQLPDTVGGYLLQTIKIRDGLMQQGVNTIRLLTEGNEHAALIWRVYRKP